MKKFLIAFSLLVVVGAGVFYSQKASACWFCSSDATQQQQTEEQKVADNQSKLLTAVPIPQLENSLERSNISKRLTLWNDSAKISYIYLLKIYNI